MRLIFISSADSKYYPLLLEWIASIRRTAHGKDAAIGILDVGLTPEQHQTVQTRADHVIIPEWPPSLPMGRDYHPFMRACVCRPFLRDLFPGYDLYFWMDSDTWVQNPDALDWFITGGMQGALTLTSQTDRAFMRSTRIQWLGPLPIKVSGFYYSNAKRAFGWRTAQRLFPNPVLLAGAFTLHVDAPHWTAWQHKIAAALVRGKVFTAEQLTMGMIIHDDGLPVHILPSWMHWMCGNKPLWDDSARVFVEPFLPHHPIGILHLSGVDAMRLDRGITDIFETLGGGSVALSYRCPFYDGERDKAVP